MFVCIFYSLFTAVRIWNCPRGICSSLISVSVIKHQHKVTWRKRGISSYALYSIILGGQGLGGRKQSKIHGEMLFTVYPWLPFSQVFLYLLGIALPSLGWALTHQSIIKKISYRRTDNLMREPRLTIIERWIKNMWPTCICIWVCVQ